LVYTRFKKRNYFINIKILLGIFLLIIGAYLVIENIDDIIVSDNNIWNTNITKPLSQFEYITILLLIYFGTIAYTVASYYHLKLKNWTFLKSLLIAIPLVLIEYQFSLRGNFLAKTFLKMNAIQIALITMTFYFINAWLLNYFVLYQKVVWWREILAFIFIILAFVITTQKT
jgi:hypothetical protein